MDIKENRGVIFKNYKKTAKEHPDYRGEINVNGEHYEISLWVNESKEGKKYFAATIKEPYQNQAPAAPAAPQPDIDAAQEMDNDLPF